MLAIGHSSMSQKHVMILVQCNVAIKHIETKHIESKHIEN